MRKLAMAMALSASLVPTMAQAATKDFSVQGYALPADKPVTVVMMRPSVDVGELQAGGLAQPNADWTNQARANVEKALREQLKGRNIQFVAMEDQLASIQKQRAELEARCAAATAAREAAFANQAQAQAAAAAAPVAEPSGAAAAPNPATATAPIVVDAPPIPEECGALAKAVNHDELMAQYNSLHKAVIDAILVHQYGMGDGKLPTKKDAFSYTLGPGTAELGKVANANYGIFVMTYDQFASASRKAMQVVGALGCLFGVCAIIGGGVHVGYISMVELDTGNIVWFNLLRGSKGDVREEEGAKGMVAAITLGMPTRPGEMATGHNMITKKKK